MDGYAKELWLESVALRSFAPKAYHRTFFIGSIGILQEVFVGSFMA